MWYCVQGGVVQGVVHRGVIVQGVAAMFVATRISNRECFTGVVLRMAPSEHGQRVSTQQQIKVTVADLIPCGIQLYPAGTRHVILVFTVEPTPGAACSHAPHSLKDQMARVRGGWSRTCPWEQGEWGGACFHGNKGALSLYMRLMLTDVINFLGSIPFACYTNFIY